MNSSLIIKQVLSNKGVIFIDTCSLLNREITTLLAQIYKQAIPNLHGWDVFVLSSVYNEIKKHEGNPRIAADARRAKTLIDKYYDLGLIQFVGPPNTFADRDILREVIKYVGKREILLITEDNGLINDALHAGVTCIKQDYPLYTLSIRNGIQKSGASTIKPTNGNVKRGDSHSGHCNPNIIPKNKPVVPIRKANKNCRHDSNNDMKKPVKPSIKYEQSALNISIGVKELIKHHYLNIPSSEIKNIINILKCKDSCASGKYKFHVERRPLSVVVKLTIPKE